MLVAVMMTDKMQCWWFQDAGGSPLDDNARAVEWWGENQRWSDRGELSLFLFASTAFWIMPLLHPLDISILMLETGSHSHFCWYRTHRRYHCWFWAIVRQLRCWPIQARRRRSCRRTQAWRTSQDGGI